MSDACAPAVFDDLKSTLSQAGATAAIDQLCALLRERKDYGALFYALLLKKRHELNVSPIPTGPAQDLPEAAGPGTPRGASRALAGRHRRAREAGSSHQEHSRSAGRPRLAV